jgi:hypothetical protein
MFRFKNQTRQSLGWLFSIVILLLSAAGCTMGVVITAPPSLAPSATPEPVPFTVSDIKKVTTTGELEENWATLCPNMVSFFSSRNVEEEGAQKNYRVGQVFPDGSFNQVSKKGNFEDVKPSCSPKGQIVVERMENGLTNVFTMNYDGSNVQPLIDLVSTLHGSSPRFSHSGDSVVMTISDCKVCVPEDPKANTQFAIVQLDQRGRTKLIQPPAELNWGYKNNAAFNDDASAIIFSVYIGEHSQIAQATNIWGDRPEWKQLTFEPFEHVRPIWLPGRNDAFLYFGIMNGRLDVYLSYHSKPYNLTQGFGPCKDPDVMKQGTAYKVIATCDNEAGIADFKSFTLTLESVQ